MSKTIIERLKGLQRWYNVPTYDVSTDLEMDDEGELIKHEDIQAIIDELEKEQTDLDRSVGIGSTSKPFCDQTRERLAKISQDHFNDTKNYGTKR